MNRQRIVWVLLSVLVVNITACGPQQPKIEAPKGSQVSQSDSAVELSETNPKIEFLEGSLNNSDPVLEPESTPDVTSEESEDDFGGSALFDFAKADEALTAGTEFLQTGEFSKALEQFKIAAKMDTENEEVFFNLGFAHSRLSNDQEAIAAYKRTIDIFHDYGEAHNNLGNLFLKQKLYAKAIEHFMTALEIDPDHAAAHNNLGTALSRQSKFSEAVPHFAKATQLDKNYIQAWCNLGNAYIVQGRFEDSVDAFQRALSIDPSFRPALSGLQRIRVKMGVLPE